MYKVLKYLTDAEKLVGALAIGIMALLVVADIFSREFLHNGLAWAQKTGVYLMIWAGFVGASITSFKDKHLRPEIADKLWKGKSRPYFHRLRHLITFGFCLFFAYFGFVYVRDSYDLGDNNPILNISLWIVQIVIPVSFLLMSFKHLFYSIRPDLIPKKELGAH